MAEYVARDAGLNPDHIANKLHGIVTRRLVKRTVMTIVYGVTSMGARAQVTEVLRTLNILNEKEISDAAIYLTNRIFKSVELKFPASRHIQRWLAQVAREVSLSVPPHIASQSGSASAEELSLLTTPKSIKLKQLEKYTQQGATGLTMFPQTAVMWTTPIGLRTIQPYFHIATTRLKTLLQEISLNAPSFVDAVRAHKQAASFAPNFIHSLDAAHMYNTAITCCSKNITFASVHDSFWSHAGSVDEMNIVLREQFIKIHGGNSSVLNNLRTELSQRYKGNVVPLNLKFKAKEFDIRLKSGIKWRNIDIPEVPARGNFSLKNILKSKFFFC